MCCFLVPLAQAAVTTVVRKAGENKSSIWLKKLPTLEKMLWGGSVMLIVDHIVNGELSWAFPFFTALAEEGGTAVFLRELLTVGVPMSLVLTLVWAIGVLVSSARAGRRIQA
ncbi:MAG: hypothetical protein PUA47_05365 [Bacteroidales bacterium]|nr:hypothetical protein [Bacteroidales bacterium]